MKFGKNLNEEAIPEWRSCYIDYEHLKIFVGIIKKIIIMINLIKRQSNRQPAQENIQAHISHHNLINKDQSSIDPESQGQNLMGKLFQLVHEANQMFYQAHNASSKINNHFFQMKLIEIKRKYQNLQKLNTLLNQDQLNKKIGSLIQFLYIQANYLKKMKTDNNEAQRKILKKHKKYSTGLIPTPKLDQKLNHRLFKELKRQMDALQNDYVQISKGPSKKNRAYLRQIAQKVQVKHSQSFLFGAYVGISATIIAVLIVILAISGKSIQTDPVFNRDFPTWRGIAFFILYTWVIGLNTYMFEQFNVSHRLIFHYNEHHYSTSTVIFVLAGVFSAFFLLVFTVYTLQIAKIITDTQLQPHYLVAIVWGSFIFFWINPLPIILWRTRLYFFKIVFISAVSPFIGVPFQVVWMTDQLVSLVTPLKDFAYTICYYQNIDFSVETEVSQNYCTSSTRVQIVFIIGAIAYSYRAIQCMRQGYDKKAYLFTPEFFNTIKYFSSLVTLIISFQYKAEDQTLFAAWLVCAAISTIYSFVWDLKMDWGLFQPDSPRRFLRKNLTYHPYQFYYIVISVNFIFRLAWLATLSPAIVENTFGSPQLFSLVTGAMQIIRRGFWNLLRVQKQHLANCKKFEAMPQTAQNIREQIIQKLQNAKNIPSSEDSLQNIYTDLSQIKQKTCKNRSDTQIFMELIKQEIASEEVAKQKRKQRVKTIKKEIKKLENKIEKIFGSQYIKKDDSDDD